MGIDTFVKSVGIILKKHMWVTMFWKEKKSGEIVIKKKLKNII
jgi:hypothetical protein